MKRHGKNHEPEPNKPRLLVRDQLLKATARHDAAYYAAIGKSANYIAARTGLSKGAITYACRKGDIRITDYRNGQNEQSKIIERALEDQLEAALYRHLEKTLS
jgi:hypothetical protein